MGKPKRIREQIWARKHRGGLIVWKESLIKALQRAPVVEFKGQQFGSRQFISLLRNTPYEDCLISVNGRLEIQGIERYRRNGSTSFRKPKLNYWFTVVNGAWKPKAEGAVVVLQPKIYRGIK